MNSCVRRGEPQDAAVLAALGRSTFVETFVEGFGVPYPPADLTAYLARAYDIERTRAALSDPTQPFWLAERDAEVVAFASAGPMSLPHPDGRSSHAELRRLYVRREAQGLGLGTGLLHVALEWMACHTDGPLWLGVWSGNDKAQRLYRAHGFEKVGAYKYPVGSWFDDEWIFKR